MQDSFRDRVIRDNYKCKTGLPWDRTETHWEQREGGQKKVGLKVGDFFGAVRIENGAIDPTSRKCSPLKLLGTVFQSSV